MRLILIMPIHSDHTLQLQLKTHKRLKAQLVDIERVYSLVDELKQVDKE